MSRVGKCRSPSRKAWTCRSRTTRSASRARGGTLVRPRERAGHGQATKRQAELRARPTSRVEANAMSGTMRALVTNMVNGVTKGFEKKLEPGRRGLPCQAPGQQAEPADRLLAPGGQGHARGHHGGDARPRPKS